MLKKDKLRMNFKWNLNGDNKYSITIKVNGDEYEFNCNLPIRNILASETVSDEILDNNIEEYYGNLFKNDELFESDVSLFEANKIIESQIENEK